jgi:hypothetical protein
MSFRNRMIQSKVKLEVKVNPYVLVYSPLGAKRVSSKRISIHITRRLNTKISVSSWKDIMEFQSKAYFCQIRL